MKKELREKAIILRKQGLSYREIMAEIPIAKSTLSDWLHSVGLSKHQKQRLTDKKLAAIKRGGEAKHQQRVVRTKEIIENAKQEIGTITKRELWLIGIMLYWAEGSKEKEHHPGSRASFTNSDPNMIIIFLEWLRQICHKTFADITIDITIHQLQKHRTAEIVEFWANTIGCPTTYFQHIYYKKGNSNTRRKNVGKTYHGILKINVKSSSTLLRQIAGWTEGVVNCFR
jgi:hypothetical protein